MNCKFCNHKDCNIIKDIISPHNSLKYCLYACERCGSFFFDKDQHPVSLDSLYYDLSQTRGEFPEEFVPSRSWQKQVLTIKKLFGGNPGSVLDMGCRTGDFLMHFDKPTECEGIELSKHFAGIAEKRGIKVHDDFLEKIEFTQSYDVVTLFAVMEHLESSLDFLNKLNTLVKEGGILVIMIPTHQSFKRKWLDFTGKTWHMYSPPEHLNFYSRQFLDKYLSEKGFNLIHRFYTSGGMVTPFPQIKLLNIILKKLVNLFDHSWFNRFPVFDHMYSYYQLESSNNQVEF